ncbi:FtsI Cell division protein FtsI/penicillin-binding protein 2 [Flavobacteriaceae bacterium]
MKYKILFPLLLLGFIGCKKSELSLTPALEKKLCQPSYNSAKEYIDGYKVTTFIDTTVQKIAEGALIKALNDNQAEYGCIVLMETNTGKIKAMVNLNKDSDGAYKSKTTTAVSQTNEPGGLMRTFDLLALLEDKKEDTTSVFDTHGGKISFLGKQITDSHAVEGKVSLATAYKFSSNTVFAQAINDSYASNPELFCNRYKKMGLHKSLGIPFESEGLPTFPEPKTSQWSNITLPWLSIGYGLTLTPVQILTFYNAIANNGVMVKPLFLSEIKDNGVNIKKYAPEVLNSKIASEKTISILQHLLTKKANGGGNTVLTSNNVKIAGTGATVQIDYADQTIIEKKYLASFVGYFPANKSKYSVVCFIYNPKIIEPLYSVIACGDVIKKIAENVK